MWLTSESTATFKASVNGAEFRLTLNPNQHELTGMCL